MPPREPSDFRGRGRGYGDAFAAETRGFREAVNGLGTTAAAARLSSRAGRPKPRHAKHGVGQLGACPKSTRPHTRASRPTGSKSRGRLRPCRDNSPWRVDPQAHGEETLDKLAEASRPPQGGDSRRGGRDNSRRRVVRAGRDSPPRVGPRHYRVPRHYLGAPFLRVPKSYGLTHVLTLL